MFCPDYLILDEPIDGLDPLSGSWFEIYCGGCGGTDKIALVSSHNLRDGRHMIHRNSEQRKMMIERDLMN